MRTIQPNRRLALSMGVAGLATCLVAGSTVANATDSDLPQGFRRGKVIDYVDGRPIYEVLDSQGAAQGVALSAGDAKTVQASLKELDNELNTNTDRPWARQRYGAAPQSVTLCAAAIAWFVAQTVFPAAKFAKLAWRLGKLVQKYGARTVARIWRGARNITDRTAQQEIIDLAKALSGVGGLSACGIPV